MRNRLHNYLVYFLYLVIIISFIISDTLWSTDYYVKTNGSNGAAGTSWSTAWQTIQYAENSISSGDVVYVSNGVYNESVTIDSSSGVSFIGYGSKVLIDPGTGASYGFNIQSLNNIRVENFEFTNSSVAMIFLNNSDNCTITNNYLHHIYAPANNGSAIRLNNGSDKNYIAGNNIFAIAANVGNNCYGIHTDNSDNNIIMYNDIYESGQATPAIDFHAIYVYNSSNTYIRYNHVHDMDHYGIHIKIDGSGPINTATKILDNVIHGMERGIVTENNPAWSLNNALNGQVIARNKIWAVRIGIVWLNTCQIGGDGTGGPCYKNSVSWDDSSDSQALCFTTAYWAKVNLRYNSFRGLYDGVRLGNNGHYVYNNVMYDNTRYNIVNYGSWVNTIYYNCLQSGKVGSQISVGAGNIYADPLVVDKSNTRLQWNSSCIGAAQATGSVRGAMGAHPSYLRAALNYTGMVTTYTMVFVTGLYNEIIPSNGKIKIEFPSGFSFSSPSATTIANIDGSLSIDSVSGSTIVLSRSGGSAIPVNRPFKLRINNVVNPGTHSSNYYCIISTMSNSDTVIEQEESNNFRVLTAPPTDIWISKSVDQITLNSTPEFAVPGSTIKYSIIYSNTGITAGNNIVIYDKIDSNVSFKTSYLGTATSWSLEFSTNTIPDQSFMSSDYTNQVVNKQDVKWVRWTKSSVSASEDGLNMYFEVIIR